MKNLLILLLICSASFANAQVVNIPDPGFKQYLLGSTQPIDTNGDGEIEVSEAEAVTSLLIEQFPTNDSIRDLTGIQAFSNMTNLWMTGLGISACDLNGMNQLTHLDINEQPHLISLNTNGCVNLEHCFVTNSPLQNVSFTTNKKLRELKLTLYDFTGIAYIPDLDLSSCDSLYQAAIDVNYPIQTLNISNLSKLSLLEINFVNNFIARNCTGLTFLQFINSVSNLDLTGCINLRSIFIYTTDLFSLDLSTCTNLASLDLTGAYNFQYLNIKNGSEATHLAVNSALPVNICADDFEIADASNMIIANGFTNFNMSSSCSFFPGGTYNTIKGKVKLDLGNNGCDASDAGMGNVPIKITDTSGFIIIRYTAPSGNFAHYPYKGLFTITPYFAYPYFSISPLYSTVAFDTANSLVDSANFCITANGVHNDLEITLLPMGPARPGFASNYQLVYKNRGTTVQSGNIQLNYDNSKMNFNYGSVPPASQSAGQLSWNYTNLVPFETRTIAITFNEFASPINNVGDTLIYFATVNPISADETPQDNSFILPQRLVGSYDPNNKQCLEGNNIIYDDIDKSLHYIIRFQNTGTDTAFNVVVADSLSDKFDWNSVEIISSSHACDIQQKNGRLEFFFQNIKLPYSAINEPASHGYVAFSIKPKSTVIIGDSLNNKAAIYFDFNQPVVTNTASTIVSPASTVPVKLEYFSVSKKNETNLLTWKAPSTTGSTIFNIERSADGIHFNKIGDITATAERSQLPFNFTDAIPLTGKNYYRLKITNADGVSFYSKILVIGNNKSGLDIIAITSDHNNVSVYFNSDKEQTIQMKIIAGDGKLVYTGSKSLNTGSSTISLPFRNIATGIYTLLVYSKDAEVITKRFIK